MKERVSLFPSWRQVSAPASSRIVDSAQSETEKAESLARCEEISLKKEKQPSTMCLLIVPAGEAGSAFAFFASLLRRLLPSR